MVLKYHFPQNEPRLHGEIAISGFRRGTHEMILNHHVAPLSKGAAEDPQDHSQRRRWQI